MLMVHKISPERKYFSPDRDASRYPYEIIIVALEYAFHAKKIFENDAAPSYIFAFSLYDTHTLQTKNLSHLYFGYIISALSE